MSLFTKLGRAVAIVTVVAGIALCTLAVQGVTRVDTRLELAAAEQSAPVLTADRGRAAARPADCPSRGGPGRDHDREV